MAEECQGRDRMDTTNAVTSFTKFDSNKEARSKNIKVYAGGNEGVVWFNFEDWEWLPCCRPPSHVH